MANTFQLVGSPLGLFTLQSRPTRDGMSTFNGGSSRNVNVDAYNTGREQTTNIRGRSGNIIDSPVSLFSGGTLPNFWPNINTIGTDLDTTGTSREYTGINRDDLHNNDVYDTSILNIIEKLSFSKMAALRPQDFAYLKNIGVFPNNRLMIARRFLSPVKDNIMGKSGTPPKSILISWKPEGEDFLDISFGEEWTEAEADFTNVLNSLGENFRTGGMGTGLGKGINMIPLPGVTEDLQRKFLERIGILDEDKTDRILPSGDPNIIKMAKRRKTIGYNQQGSGLKCTVNIEMVVEYEQKFISGIDPTIAWMDIINNVLSFGTSKSTNYGLSDKFSKNLNNWTKDPSTLIDSFLEVIKGVIGEIKNTIQGLLDVFKPKGEKEEAKTQKERMEDFEKKRKKELQDKVVEGLKKLVDNTLIGQQLRQTIRKYRVELMGIANALSGAPSTPWHVTIGNPLRPVFCSGDMYISGDVNLKLGPTLAFNDLPSNITVKFTLTNARPWGLQEILAKFNTGHLRTVNVQKDYLQLENSPPGGIYFDPLEPDSEIENTSGQSDSSQGTTDTQASNPYGPLQEGEGVNAPFVEQTKENVE